MEKLEFKARVQGLVHQVIYSIGGKKIPYKICSLQGNILTLQRESTQNFVELNVDELYEYFTKETIHNTQTARKYVTTGYVYSPAAAVINAIKYK